MPASKGMQGAPDASPHGICCGRIRPLGMPSLI